MGLLLDGLADGPDAGTADPLDAAAEHVELYQAQGMVMIQLGVDLAEAMARLRAHAYASDRRLVDVARDVVARTPRLDEDSS